MQVFFKSFLASVVNYVFLHPVWVIYLSNVFMKGADATYEYYLA